MISEKSSYINNDYREKSYENSTNHLPTSPSAFCGLKVDNGRKRNNKKKKKKIDCMTVTGPFQSQVVKKVIFVLLLQTIFK